MNDHQHRHARPCEESQEFWGMMERIENYLGAFGLGMACGFILCALWSMA